MAGRTLSLALVSVLLASSLVHAQPNAVLDELQERCAKSAAGAFAKEHDGNFLHNGDYTTFSDYSAHYNARLNKCFYLEKINVTQGKNEKHMFTSLKLFDLLENNQYGLFMRDFEGTISDCYVQDATCHSEEEWRQLVKPYLED